MKELREGVALLTKCIGGGRRMSDRIQGGRQGEVGVEEGGSVGEGGS